MNKEYEILAPVGNRAMFDAALAAGANAVYLAGDLFGARTLVEKFNIEDIEELVQRAHINKMKVYITVNTLVKDDEMGLLFSYLKGLAKAGVDAIIVQDLGVYNLISRYFKFFELHASTQMAANTLYSAKFLQDLGFSRVVVGRETALSEIEKIGENTDLEIEAFVHGALCVSISGQCLMSSFIGGRSGNRGKCAQPCRKNYDIYDINRKKISKMADSFISARDLCFIDDLDAYLDRGVYSLKIEGRLKKPEYVYTSVTEYRNALEGRNYDTDKLSLVSNRSFTKGLAMGDFAREYYFTKDSVGGVVLGRVKNKKLILDKKLNRADTIRLESIRGKSFNITVTRDYEKDDILDLSFYKDIKENSIVYKLFSQDIKDTLESVKNPNGIFPIKLRVVARLGQKISVDIFEDSFKSRIYSEFLVETAQNKATDREEIFKRLGKLGGSPYYLQDFELESDENIFIPASILNQLKRNIVESINENYIVENKHFIANYIPITKNKQKRDLALSLEIYEGLESYLAKYRNRLNFNNFRRIYIHSLEGLELLRAEFSGQIFFVGPRIMVEEEYKLLDLELSKYEDYLDGFAINNIGEYLFYKKYNKIIHPEMWLNIYNSEAIEFFNNLGIRDYSLSEELNKDQIRDLKWDMDEVEIMGYANIATMIMKHCPASPIKACRDSSKCETCPYKHIYMENEMDSYRVVRDHAYSEILTVEPKNLLGRILEIRDLGISLVRLVDRGNENIDLVAEKFKKALEGKVFKERNYLGHFERGIE